MAAIISHVVSLLGVACTVSILIAGILFLNLIQTAFAQDGVVWGFIAVLFPPGTYFYCRKNWDTYRKKFITIAGLLIAALVLWVIAKIAR